MPDTPQDNPFQPPTATLQDAAAATTGEPLFRLAAVGIATFFGTPIAGAWVMVQNLKTLGRLDDVRKAWLMGLGFTIGMFVIGYFLPDNISGAPMAIATVVGMYQFAKQTTGAALQQHSASGGAFLSNWRAFAISLLFLLAVMAAVFVAAFVLAPGPTI